MNLRNALYSVGLGLLATFIANLVPEPFNLIAIVVVVGGLLVGSTVYLARREGAQHVQLVRFLRFVLVAFVIGVFVGVLTIAIPTVYLRGLSMPSWLVKMSEFSTSQQVFTVHELVYSSVIAIIGAVAYWTSRRLLRPMSFVLAGVAGAVLVDSAFMREPFADWPVGIDPQLTYITWALAAIGFVLLNALIPIAVVEMKDFLRPRPAARNPETRTSTEEPPVTHEAPSSALP